MKHVACVRLVVYLFFFFVLVFNVCFRKHLILATASNHTLWEPVLFSSPQLRRTSDVLPSHTFSAH